MLEGFGSSNGLSRRHVLSGIAAFGAAGVAIKAPSLRQDGGPTPGASAPTGVGQSVDDGQHHRGHFTLHGMSSNLITPDDGGPSTTTADLVDSHGNTIGAFWSAAVAAGSSVLLFHSFVLPEGTLQGEGSGALDEATFAIVGGTGSFKGGTGQYIARQRPISAGGDGSAEFVFDLTPGKE
jgi:hypothetical protein